MLLLFQVFIYLFSCINKVIVEMQTEQSINKCAGKNNSFAFLKLLFVKKMSICKKRNSNKQQPTRTRSWLKLTTYICIVSAVKNILQAQKNILVLYVRKSIIILSNSYALVPLLLFLLLLFCSTIAKQFIISSNVCPFSRRRRRM